MNKLDDIIEINRFLERYKLQKWTQEEIDNIDRPITYKEMS